MKKEDIEIAKEIIGKWGYEEKYWWEPIAKAITKVREEEREKITTWAKQNYSLSSQPLSAHVNYIKLLQALLPPPRNN